jgi:iron-sulfur cluster protein
MAQTRIPSSLPTPREVADKSSKSNLLQAIRMSLGIESAAVRHNTQTFNINRYEATSQLADYDALKDRARTIKELAIDNLPTLIERLEVSVLEHGGHFYLAANGAEAARYIADVCTRHEVKVAVKAKSLTTDEIRLNHALETRGIEVVETDLAEFILQIADEQPSHIIAPAIHYSRERISELFKRTFGTTLSLDTGEELTRFARERLRGKFLAADAGISGANLIASDGTLMLVESEANIRMTTMLPPLHIAVAGIEKVVPRREDFAPFLELLAASGTGQPMSAYTSIIRPPLSTAPLTLSAREPKPREFHLVLIDNGRMQMRRDPVLKEALYCIRCSACLNACANFQAVGGHAFGGETYSGGIGGSWEAGTGKLENGRFSELCTGCSRCVPQCPVRIDIPWLNVNLRERLNHAEDPSIASNLLSSAVNTVAPDKKAPLQKLFFGNYHKFAKWGCRLAPISNWMRYLPFGRRVLEAAVGLDSRRELPTFSRRTLEQLCRSRRTKPALHRFSLAPRVVLFVDVFTNYGEASNGIDAIDVLEALGIGTTLTKALPDGRASISQGLIATAREQAEQAAKALAIHIDAGYEVLVVEPSVLAMFRLDYRHLVSSPLYEKIRDHTHDVVEYIWNLAKDREPDLRRIFDVGRWDGTTRLMFHAHCQQRSIGCGAPTEALLRALGFDVVTSRVECCGMAGSFGYKKDFYELSIAVGEDLFTRVTAADAGGIRTLIASGTSCREQLRDGMRRPAMHPIQLLAALLRQPKDGVR